LWFSVKLPAATGPTGWLNTPPLIYGRTAEPSPLKSAGKEFDSTLSSL